MFSWSKPMSISTDACSETSVPTNERVPSWAIETSVSCCEGLVLGVLEKSTAKEGCDKARSDPELPSKGLWLAGLLLAAASSNMGGRDIVFLNYE